MGYTLYFGSRQMDERGGNSILLVVGHGAATKIEGVPHSYMFAGDELISAPRLAKWLTSKRSLKGIEEINLAMCHSADYSKHSFGQALANNMGLAVTAYEGPMVRYEPQLLLDQYTQLVAPLFRTIYMSENYVSTGADLIRRGRPSEYHRPVKFLPDFMHG